MSAQSAKTVVSNAIYLMEIFYINAEKTIQAKGLKKALDEATDNYIKKEEKIKKVIREYFTSKFGKEDGCEKFLLIRPYLEGKQDITEPIENILSQFNYTHYSVWGMGTAVPIVTNRIKNKLRTLENHRRIYMEKVENAYLDFGKIDGSSAK
jgi:hypothetical protein